MWLLLVLSDGPDYGYNVMQRLDRMFAGYWKPKAGTIYPALEKLTEHELVSRSHEHREEGPDRTYYTITPRGEEVLRRGMERWSRVMDQVDQYGERHRAIRVHRARLDRKELGDILVRLGEAVKKGAFDISTPLPTVEPSRVELTEPLFFKLLYAYEEDRLEVEMEFEWKPENTPRTRSKLEQNNTVEEPNKPIILNNQPPHQKPRLTQKRQNQTKHIN